MNQIHRRSTYSKSHTPISSLKKLGAIAVIPLAAIVALVLLFSTLWVNSSAAAPEMAPEATILYVTEKGNLGSSCTIAVPCTLSRALFLSADGDEIRLAKGTYTSDSEPVLLVMKDITVSGGFSEGDWNNADPVVNLTILDAEENGRVVEIDGTNNSHAVIQGLTIRNGLTNGGGAGIYVESGATATIQNNRIYNNLVNSTSFGGGGIYAAGATIIDNNHIYNNTSTYGGGIRIGSGSSGTTSTITNNYIYDNDATLNAATNGTQGHGGGIFIANNSDGFIEGNTIYTNIARDGGGIAVYQGASATIQNNVLYNNNATLATANEGGGGIMLRVATVTLWNNTIAYNNSGQNGGGIFINVSTVEMTNNAVVSNTTTNLPLANTGVYQVVGTISGGYNNTYNNTSNTGLLTDIATEDPSFINNSTPNLRLSGSSINNGDTTFVTVTTDIDQQARPNGAPDIGADEFYANTPLYALTPLVSEAYVSRDVGSATFNHQLENFGTQADTYIFTCSNSQGWTVTACASGASNLNPGEISALQTSITVPTDTLPLAAGTTLITATAVNSTDVIVAAIHTIVAPRPGITFTANITRSLLPGEIFTMAHTLQNLSDAPDTFLIQLSGDALNWATLLPSNPSEVSLVVGESRTINTLIRVNPTAASGFSDIITIKASSEFSPSVSATVVNTITAKPTAGDRFVSTGGNDNGGNNNCTVSISPCRTVAHAVGQARAGDAVLIAAGIYNETQLPINLNAQIEIRGRGETPANVTISGAAAGTRLFNVAAGLVTQPTLRNLTLANGFGASGGAVFVDTAAYIKFVSVNFEDNTAVNGGAIYAQNNAVVTLDSCSFTGNSSTGTGTTAGGGAMYLSGSTLYMQNSRFELNTAVSNGGAIHANGASINATNNLIASNNAAANGGGIYASGGSMSVKFATITQNSGGSGGGIYANSTTVSIEDTAIVSNTAATFSSIRAGTPPANFRYNAIWPIGSADFTPDVTNLTLTSNPVFDGVDYHVLAGNELVDADVRNSSSVNVETDFEGDFRPSDQGYDIGWDELAGCRAKRGDTIYGNIQEAVNVITSTTNFIQVTGICRGADEVNNATVHLDINDNISSTLIIQGGWNGDFSERTYEVTTVDPEGEGRAFYINGITTTLELLTIVNGNATGLGGIIPTDPDAGGAIFVATGEVMVNDVNIGNSTAVLGGAVYNQAGSLRITSFERPHNFDEENGEVDLSQISVISDNIASEAGGGIYNRLGSMTVNRAIVRGNTAVNGGAVAANGGGVYLHGGTNQLLNIVLADNAASGNGGGVYSRVASQLWHMTVYSNSASSGGGLYNETGNSVIKNSIFEGNQATTGEAINVAGGSPAVDYNGYFDDTVTGVPNGTGSFTGLSAKMFDPDNGDYHLTDLSPVLDIGVTPAITITTDFDGKIRPSNQGYDMGADELLGCLARTGGVIYGNIQLALNAAVDGAVIDVAGNCSGVHSYEAGGTLGEIRQTVHITKNIHLIGGWDIDFLEQGVVSTTLDANTSGRVIYIAPDMEVIIEDFDILGGDASRMDGNGGAIYADHAADVSILNNNFYSNTATNGAVVYSVDSVITIDKGNDIYRNESTNGAIYLTQGVGFTATVQNNFFYENRAAANGAAIYSAAGDNILRHNTVYSNTAVNGAGFYLAAGAPDVRSNIFMSNTASSGGALAGLVPGVVDYNDYVGNLPTATDGTVIIGANAISSDPGFIDADNGDFAVSFISPVVDKGDPAVDLLHDAFETIRPSHNGMDIGAYEVGGCYARDVLAPTVIYGSVQRAVDNAQVGTIVEVDGICLGVQTVGNSDAIEVKQTLYISKSLTIDGIWEYEEDPTTEVTQLDAQGRGRALYIDSSAITVTVRNIEFLNGNGSSAGGVNGGGAVYNAGTAVILTNINMHDNNAANGGALYNAGELTLASNKFSYNSATAGGAIYNISDGFMLIDSTAYTNTADNGGAVYNNISVSMPAYTATVKNNSFYSYTVSNNGGAVYHANGRFLIDGNTIHHSNAQNGGAIYLTGGANTVNVWNNIIYDTTALAGAIYDNNTNSNIWYNTLYRNNATDGQGAGIYSAAASTSSIYNNIVDGGPSVSNGSAIAIDHTPTPTTVGYNLIRGYLARYTPNTIFPSGDIYDLFPTYVNSIENDYHLQYGSVGMDAGLGLPTISAVHDIDDDPRPVNNGVDIGADEINTCQLLVNDRIFNVLQKAIDYAEDNDFTQIRMARGVCSGVQTKGGTEQVGYISKNIEFTGSLLPDTFSDPNDYSNPDIAAVSSRIDARGEGRALFIAPTANVIFTHVAFVNGNAASDASNGNKGGGLYANGAANVTLHESPLCQNTADNGGGLYGDNESTVTLSGASAGACRVFRYFDDFGSPFYAVFAGNEANANGGGVYLDGNFSIRNYGLQRNTAVNGAGVYANGNGSIINGIFLHNIASGEGAGLYNNGTTDVYHNTIVGNIANGSGGGMKDNSALTVNSSIIYANISGGSGNDDGGVSGVSGAQLSYNLFYSNTPTQTTHGVAFVLEDPLLYGSVYPSVYSPAIDQADETLIDSPNFITYDANMVTRPDGDPNHLGIVRSDIGAMEYYKDFGCRITPLNPTRFGVAGQDTVYNFSVQNTGWPLPPAIPYHTYTDTITVTLNSGIWPSVLSGGGSPLVFYDMGPNESRAFTLTVSVPNELSGIDASTVTCTPASRPTRKYNSTATTSIGENRRVEIGIQQAASLLPGEEITFTHTITNVGNVEDTYELVSKSGTETVAEIVDASGNNIDGITMTLSVGETTSHLLHITALDTAIRDVEDKPGATVQSVEVAATQYSVLDFITILPISGTRYVSAIAGSDDSNCTAAGSPCATIQWAIDQAVAGDTILVAAGTYTTAVTATVGLETITQTLFIDKSLSIIGGYSINDDFANQKTITNAVILSGENNRRVVYITNGNEVMLGGLFIQDGYSADNGGGIYNNGSGLIITSTLLLNNSSELNGGGLYQLGNALSMQSVVVAGNSAINGAGFYVADPNPSNLNNSTSTNNAVAGINSLENNTFVNNAASDRGGAGYLSINSFDLLNNIFDSNTAAIDSTIHLGGGGLGDNGFNLYNNNSPIVPITGTNINGDPGFIIGDAYYHISPLSIAVGAGTEVGLDYLFGVDIDGERRRQGGSIDIGADEVTQTPQFLFAPTPLTAILPIAGSPPHVYTHILTNTSSFVDGYTFDSSDSDPLGTVWTVVVTTDPVDTTAIAAGGNVTVTVSVSVGAGNEGHVNTAVITATSTTDVSIFATVEDTTTVAQLTPGVEIGVSQMTNTLANTAVVFQHTITNTGSGANEYTLSRTAPPAGWGAVIEPSGSIWLEAGATAPFTLTVTVPNAGLGDSYEALIAAESVDMLVSDQLTDTVTVIGDITSDISISPTVRAETIAPGETAVYTHTVTNNGATTENSITIDSDNPPTGWSVTIDPPTISSLPAGSGREVIVSVAAPLNAGNATVPITITAVASGGSSAQATDTTTTIVPTGISLIPSAQIGLTAPGETRTYTHTLKNWGAETTVTLTYTEAANPPTPVFAVQMSPSSVTIPANGEAEITVEVIAPISGTAGTVHTVNITAASDIDSAVATAVDTTVIAFDIELTPAEQLKIAPAGTVVTFTHTFTNVNGANEGFDVSASSMSGWQIDYNPKSFTLGMGLSQQIVVTVTIPGGIAPGIEDATELVVTWQGNSALSASAIDRARTSQIHNLSFTESQAQFAIPNSTVVYTHTLQNMGNGPDNFEITAVSSNGWTIDPIAPINNLAPNGGTTTITVTLNVPPTATLGITDTMVVMATSTISNTHFKTLTNTTTITNSIGGGDSFVYLPIILKNYTASVAGLRIEPATSVQTIQEGNTAVYNHTVFNDGDSFENVTISFSGNNWTATAAPASFDLEPGNSRAIVVSVVVPAGSGGQVDVVTVTATGSSGETAVATDTTTSSSTPVTPTMTPSPTTPPPPSCEFTPPATGNPPGVDLIVTNVTLSPATPAAGQQVLVQVTIKNQGQTNVIDGNNFYLDFYVNPIPQPPGWYKVGVRSWGIQSVDLPAGASKTYAANYTFGSPGDMRIWAQVDTDKTVIEANENNNVYGCKTVTVTGTAVNMDKTPAPQSDGDAAPRFTPTPFWETRSAIAPEQDATPEPSWLITTTPAVQLPPQSTD